MLILLLGLVIMLATHAFTMARSWREAVIRRIGPVAYRLLYSLKSLIGFTLIVIGFGQYRAEGWVQLWQPPIWGRHAAMTLMWFAFVALASMGPRPGRIGGWLRHPMLVAIKIWALAHLLANGDLGGLLLFGSFLGWAVLDRISLKWRGDLGKPRLASFTRADAVSLIAGTLAYVAMLFLHPYLIGVAIMPM